MPVVLWLLHNGTLVLVDSYESVDLALNVAARLRKGLGCGVFLASSAPKSGDACPVRFDALAQRTAAAHSRRARRSMPRYRRAVHA